MTYTPTLEEADSATLDVPLVGLLDDTPDLQVIMVQGHGIDRHIAVPQVVTFPDTFRYPDDPPVMPIAVQDTGEAVLHLSMVASSPQWSVLNPGSTFQVGGGSALQLMMQFSPTTTGKADGTLTIMDDDRQVPMAVVQLHGTGIDRDVAIGPPTIDLGTTGLGVAVRLSDLDPSGLQVTNMDATNTFVVHQIQIVTTTGDAGAFTIDTAPMDQTLAPSSTDTYDLVFDPSVEGTYAASVELFLDKDPDPRSATVTGRAVFVDAHGGGGCAAGGDSLGALLLVGALLLARRRRALAVAAVAVVAAGAGVAAADDSTRNLDVSVFSPTPATTGTGIQLQSPTVGAANDYAIWAMVTYARKPLDLDTGTDDFAIANRTTYDLGGAYAFLDRFEVGLHMPLYTQSGDGLMPGVAGYAEKPASGTARGDLALHGKVTAWRSDALALGAAASLVLPTASDQEFAGVGSPEGRVLALASYAVMPQLVLQVNLGAVLRRGDAVREHRREAAARCGASARRTARSTSCGCAASCSARPCPAGSQTVRRPDRRWARRRRCRRSRRSPASATSSRTHDADRRSRSGAASTTALGSPAVRGVVALTFVPSARLQVPIDPAPPPPADGDADGDGIPD